MKSFAVKILRTFLYKVIQVRKIIKMLYQKDETLGFYAFFEINFEENFICYFIKYIFFYLLSRDLCKKITYLVY